MEKWSIVIREGVRGVGKWLLGGSYLSSEK